MHDDVLLSISGCTGRDRFSQGKDISGRWRVQTAGYSRTTGRRPSHHCLITHACMCHPARTSPSYISSFLPSFPSYSTHIALISTHDTTACGSTKLTDIET